MKSTGPLPCKERIKKPRLCSLTAVAERIEAICNWRQYNHRWCGEGGLGASFVLLPREFRDTNRQQIWKLTQRRSWFHTVHNYSCATHCHKWLQATKKGTRKVPEGGPIGDTWNWITNTASGLASLAVGGDRKCVWEQEWCCTSLFFCILFLGVCFWQFLNLISLWFNTVFQGLMFLCTS